MSTMLSRAYIELIPSLKGAGKVIQKELQEITGTSFAPKEPIVPKAWSQQIQDVGRQWQSTGEDISKVGSTLTKSITLPALGAATAVGGVTAALGWKRLTSIDTAQGQLKGLGYSAQDVERISGQLAEALEGGMMTMGEATSAAASGMAAGVSEGKELTRYIQLLDAAVVGGNGTFDEMNQIFSRVVDQGRLTRTEFDMIAQRMPGFSGAVQDAMGVSSDEMYRMLAAGEITSDEFLDIMDDFAGDMATSYAETWEGMVQNTWAYVGIIGEALLGGVFEQSKDSIAEFLDFLSSDEVKAWAEEAGVAIGEAFSTILGWVREAIDWWIDLDGETKKLILSIGGIAVAAGPVLLVIGKVVGIVGSLLTFIGTLSNSPLGPWLGRIAGGFGRLAGGQGIGGLIGSFARFAGPVGLVIAGLIAMWTHSEEFRTAVMDLGATLWELATTIWGALQPLLALIMEVAIPAFVMLADFVQIAFEELTAIVTGAINIITGIIETALGIITGDWDRAWSGLGMIVEGVWGIITGIVSGAIARVEQVIKSILEAIGITWDDSWMGVSNVLSIAWEKIKSTVVNATKAVLNWIVDAWNRAKSFTSNTWQAVLSTISSVWNSIRSFIVNMASNVVNAVLNAWNRAKSTTVGAWNGIRSAVSNGINGVVNFVRQLPSRILSALGNLGSLLLGSGKSLIDGFTRGIKNAFGNAVNAVKNGVQRVRNYFPFSPAKEGPFSGHGYTSYSGEALVSDFAEGMAAAEADVVRQAENITRAAAFDAPSMPAPSLSDVPVSAHEGGVRGGVTNNFTVNNPQAEPTSETARKASAYIGVTV